MLTNLIYSNAPYLSRDKMVEEIAFATSMWPKAPTRKAILDAFRRLKQQGRVEEWCAGDITRVRGK